VAGGLPCGTPNHITNIENYMLCKDFKSEAGEMQSENGNNFIYIAMVQTKKFSPKFQYFKV
jgi:hypothetical protein